MGFLLFLSLTISFHCANSSIMGRSCINLRFLNPTSGPLLSLLTAKFCLAILYRVSLGGLITLCASGVCYCGVE